MLYKLKNVTKDTIDLHGRRIRPKEEIKTATIEPYRLMLEQGFLKIISENDDGKAPILYINSKRKGEAFSKPFIKMNRDINNQLTKRLNKHSLDEPIDTNISPATKIKPLQEMNIHTSEHNTEQDKQIDTSQEHKFIIDPILADPIPTVSSDPDYIDIATVMPKLSTPNISKNILPNISSNSQSKNLSDTLPKNLFNDLSNNQPNDSSNNLSNSLSKDLLDEETNTENDINNPIARQVILPENKYDSNYQFAKASMRQINKSLFPNKKQHGADETASRLNKAVDDLLSQFNKITQETTDSLNGTNLSVTAQEVKKPLKISELKLLPKVNIPSDNESDNESNNESDINSNQLDGQSNTLFQDMLNDILDTTNKFVYRSYIPEDKFDEIIKQSNTLSQDKSENKFLDTSLDTSQNTSDISIQDTLTITDNETFNNTSIIQQKEEELNNTQMLVDLNDQIEKLTSSFSSILDQKLETFTKSLQNTQQIEPIPASKDKIIQSLFHLFVDHNISPEDLSNIKSFYHQIHILDNIDNNIKKQIQDANSYEELITILLNNVYPSLF